MKRVIEPFNRFCPLNDIDFVEIKNINKQRRSQQNWLSVFQKAKENFQKVVIDTGSWQVCKVLGIYDDQEDYYYIAEEYLGDTHLIHCLDGFIPLVDHPQIVSITKAFNFLLNDANTFAARYRDIKGGKDFSEKTKWNHRRALLIEQVPYITEYGGWSYTNNIPQTYEQDLSDAADRFVNSVDVSKF